MVQHLLMVRPRSVDGDRRDELPRGEGRSGQGRCESGSSGDGAESSGEHCDVWLRWVVEEVVGEEVVKPKGDVRISLGAYFNVLNVDDIGTVEKTQGR